MKLHGTVEANLLAALQSAKRFRGHPVHKDTLQHWANLLLEARRVAVASKVLGNSPLIHMIAELETELSNRR